VITMRPVGWRSDHATSNSRFVWLPSTRSTRSCCGVRPRLRENGGTHGIRRNKELG